MAVDQLPGQVREFVAYLEGVLARLDQGAGWCAVFWQRDPDGMQACLVGREVPPWDVVEALLQDLAAGYGSDVARVEAERARPLHAAAQAAHDARPGGRDALGDRFDVMLREQRYAAERQAELGRLLAAATTRDEADAIRLDLAWARDDHERATRRCAELQSRMADSDRSTVGRGGAVTRGQAADGGMFRGTQGDAAQSDGSWDDGRGGAGGFGDGSVGGADSRGVGFPDMPQQRETPSVAADQPTEVPALALKKRKRRRGSARFAGMAEEDSAFVAVPPDAEPELPAAPVAKGRSPRGARFAGATRVPAARSEQRAEPLDVVERRETAEIVATLVRLRSGGRTGEAHALLVEVAHWPAERFPLLAAELQHAGLGADWATLLWEAASLPAERLVAAADALVAAGRSADGEQMLRQGVARPAAEIGAAVLGLVSEGRRREAFALLDAYVRVRTPEEAARSAEPSPGTLVPLLLKAAKGVSDERYWDLVHALRVAGFSI
ncbi:hypothetical protein OHT57_39290 [Streptomyces sp. NBC_00285]|uniref:hypothetical protein n=1 Tax=Streptomyces sp. NBC_00285 TaxID=2975700 RepID=UPI002E2DD361|nr:hypothetical protein [Streptomyces sp. NBC_00285]